MKRLILIIYFFYSSAICYSQTDSLSWHGTIKIGKSGDKVYITSYTDFYIYYNDPVNEMSYEDFVLNMNQRNPVKRSARFLITEALPKHAKDTVFDYTTYFEGHELIKNISMKKDESDTVRLLIYVDSKGVVKFLDLSPMEKRGNDLWVYDMKRKEYKVDIVHVKTREAFNQLTSTTWIPAKIKTLKKHPSKHKKKYDLSEGYMQGILTIIYSGSPIIAED